VNDGLLVRVLHRLANLQKEFEPLANSQPMPAGVFRDRDAIDVLHREVRRAVGGSAGVKNPRDRRMIHQRQRLPFRFEPRDHLARAHTRLHYFYRYPPSHGLGLLGQPDFAQPSFADLSQKQITVDRPELRLIVRWSCRQTKSKHAGRATAI
jgi:hypothetical protein